jgi:hypothetical protein
LAENSRTEPALRAVASRLLGAEVADLEVVGGGGNSRVYRLRLNGGGSRALKVYFQDSSDPRNRMQTEFSSLQFLWRNGVRDIPEPLAASPEDGCAVYGWIEGAKIAPGSVAGGDIDCAVSFLQRVAELRAAPGTGGLGRASEACFSGAALLGNLERRLEPLRDRAGDACLSSFLCGTFLPALDRMSGWSRALLGQRFETELPTDARTLSPSDFGFHNALRTAPGDWCFLDLEYFGWDDPAKTICDFLLHPAMSLSPELQRRFGRSALAAFGFSSGLSDRVRAFYPLYGLKWCLILLNEFLPEHLRRRRFAGAAQPADSRRKQAEQLAKAERMLGNVEEQYERFPYFS